LPCHQTPILEPPHESLNTLSSLLTPSCDLQAIKLIKEPSTSIQENQELCQEHDPKHEETIAPKSNQDQIIPIQSIHNMYLLYDQDDTYEEAIHEHLDPIHNPISIHEQDIHIAPSHPPSSLIHNEKTSTCHDEIIASQEHISLEDQTNNLDLHEYNKDPNDHSTSISTTNPTSSPPSYPLGLTTLSHECSSLGQQQPLTTLPSPSNNQLKSSVQTTPSPRVNRMLQNMNYQGKGLGLHE